MTETVHVIGGGLAGLAAAVRLAEAGRKVIVHELARHAGGRCRSYFEPALGLAIDNGNHLLLSGNRAALSFLETIGSEHTLQGPAEAEFAFADLLTGARWTLRPNAGRLPWWVFSETRRAPGTRAHAYLPLAKLLWANGTKTMDETIPCGGLLYERLIRPIFLAALNTDPREGSAQLAGAVVRETLARGGEATRPLIASGGLGAAFVDPALAFIERYGAEVRFDHALRGFEFENNRVRTLDFGEDRIRLAPEDHVVLAVPAWVAPHLVNEIPAPAEFRAIVNVHFKHAPPPTLPAMLGLIGGTAEWVFAFPERLSVTISAADRFLETPREDLARETWRDVAKVAGLGADLPPWHIVKERRATIAARPEDDAQRPGTRTRWRNLMLAGDWTDTGLPATIEGAIRSGNRAAEAIRSAS